MRLQLLRLELVNEENTSKIRRAEETMSSNIILKIDGLTCGHCVSSVTEELQEIAGVSTVEVDLVVGGTSTATVATETQVESSAFEAAIAEAGYNLVSVDA